jgi:hypothetical protein
VCWGAPRKAIAGTGNWGAGRNFSNGGRTESGKASEPQPSRIQPGTHLAAPRPGAGGGPGFSSSSSSLSREGLRGAKNREKLCQGALPLLRPPDISPERALARGRPRGMD